MIVKGVIKKLFFYLKRFLNNDYCILYKGIKKTDLLIFDDIFPHPVSGFRYEEFTVLLEIFENSKIVVNPTAYRVVNTPLENHQKHIEEYLKLNVALKNKIKSKNKFVNINAKLFYCVFINNIFNNLSWVENYKIPFVFTLYPGGGFQLNETESDYKLRKIFDSPMFRHVIVTQKITRDYLVDNNFCSSENIEFVFGGVVPQISLNKNLIDKKYYLSNKITFDICFCAAKYTRRGEDKGYDVFIEVANQLAERYEFVRFHVIGGFSKDDIDISNINEKIQFYGYQNFKSLGFLYKKMDILISPNKAFVLNKGSFDGFPLGTVIEAVLNGVVVLITDELEQNNGFIPNVDLILIDSESQSILIEVEKLIENTEKLQLISQKGMEKFIEVYSNKVQMSPRISLLKKQLASN